MTPQRIGRGRLGPSRERWSRVGGQLGSKLAQGLAALLAEGAHHVAHARASALDVAKGGEVVGEPLDSSCQGFASWSDVMTHTTAQGSPQP